MKYELYILNLNLNRYKTEWEQSFKSKIKNITTVPSSRHQIHYTWVRFFRYIQPFYDLLGNTWWGCSELALTAVVLAFFPFSFMQSSSWERLSVEAEAFFELACPSFSIFCSVDSDDGLLSRSAFIDLRPSLGGDLNRLFWFLVFPCCHPSFGFFIQSFGGLLPFNMHFLQRGSSPGIMPASAFIALKWHNQCFKSCGGGSLEDGVIGS